MVSCALSRNAKGRFTKARKYGPRNATPFQVYQAKYGARARAILKRDRRRTAKKRVFSKWRKNPRRYDLKGFDTKRRR
jgi:hypothetical protein